MKMRFAFAVASALMLAGCQIVQQFVVTGSEEDTRVIAVTAVDGEVEITARIIGGKHVLRVNSEPAIPEPDTTPNRTKIKFKLQRGYAFAANGVEICPRTPPSKTCTRPPDPPANCESNGSERRVIVCRYRTPPADTVYWYTINAVHVESGLPAILDPSIWN